MILYLEYNPNEDLLMSQLNEIDRLLKALRERCFDYVLHHAPKQLKNPKAVFETMYGVKQLREQKRNLKYLLEK